MLCVAVSMVSPAKALWVFVLNLAEPQARSIANAVRSYLDTLAMNGRIRLYEGSQ
jgi:hypothetical protein